jgi:hypothetical protein
MSTHEVGWHIRLNGLQSHGVVDWIVEGQSDEIDVYDPRETLREIPKQCVQIAMSGDSFCDFQQGLISLLEGFTWRQGSLIHRR